MNARIFEFDGKPSFAVVPISEWTRLFGRVETLQDIVDGKAASAGESLPLAFVEIRLDGESALRLWREHRGMTLQAPGQRVGCKRQMLSMVENGKTTPSADLLSRLGNGAGRGHGRPAPCLIR